MLALGACGRGEGEANAADAPPVVQIGRENIAVVQRAEIRSGPALSGSLAAEREATVRAEVAGPVLQTYVEQGQRVAKGTLLARIDDTAIRDSYLSAKSAVATAEQAAQVARRNAERSTKLFEGGAIAERDLETARWNAMNAESQLADAKARLVVAEKQLEKTQVRAPFAGIVSERQVSGGDAVQPGGAMFTVIDPASMRLEAAVPTGQVQALRVGAPVEFSVSGYTGRTFTGRIERINPAADPATRQVRIYASIPNAGGSLVAGLFAEGRVASESRTGLVAPAEAVDLRRLRPTVVRLTNGKVERAEVRIGLQDLETERVEIVSGAAAGDTLLLGAAQGITPGTPARVGAPADRPVGAAVSRSARQ